MAIDLWKIEISIVLFSLYSSVINTRMCVKYNKTYTRRRTYVCVYIKVLVSLLKVGKLLRFKSALLLSVRVTTTQTATVFYKIF